MIVPQPPFDLAQEAAGVRAQPDPCMRVANRLAGAAAIELAFFRPSATVWGLAVPSSRTNWIAAMEQVLTFFASAPAAAEPDVKAGKDGTTAGSDCGCPSIEHVRATKAGTCALAGFLFWPLVDVFRLFKLAWHRQVLAAERALQARPPDWPFSWDVVS